MKPHELRDITQTVTLIAVARWLEERSLEEIILGHPAVVKFCESLLERLKSGKSELHACLAVARWLAPK